MAVETGSPSTLIDASALIALLGGEPAADEVRAILMEGTAAMTTVNLAEAVDRLARRYGLTSEKTRPVIDGLLDDALQLLAFDSGSAWRAGEIRARYYHRTRCPISLADAVLLACAQDGRRIASADEPLLRVACELGTAVTVLPSSTGYRCELPDAKDGTM